MVIFVNLRGHLDINLQPTRRYIVDQTEISTRILIYGET